MPAPERLRRLWSLACSLKLAIVLASLATLLTMAGSLIMHFNPALFGDLDRRVLGTWLVQVGARQPLAAGWLFVLVALVGALALNTLCCFADWLAHLGARWRKTGEYLIHLGFVLIVVAYLWGSMTGGRHPGLVLPLEQPVPLPGKSGVYLRLDAFEPVLNPTGRPVDMRSSVSLLRGDRPVQQAVVRFNHPLIWQDLVILPESFGRTATGLLVRTAQGRLLELKPGSDLELDRGRLRVLEFYPDVAVRDGRILPRRQVPGNPALRLVFRPARGEVWQGWYLPRNGLPAGLAREGVQWQPLRPLWREFSVLTVNRDPGARLALVGATAMLVGVVLALVSFYRKRSRGDRPQID